MKLTPITSLADASFSVKGKGSRCMDFTFNPCAFCGMNIDTWNNWKKMNGKNYHVACRDAVLFHKHTGAAMAILKPPEPEPPTPIVEGERVEVVTKQDLDGVAEAVRIAQNVNANFDADIERQRVNEGGIELFESVSRVNGGMAIKTLSGKRYVEDVRQRSWDTSGEVRSIRLTFILESDKL